MVQQVHTPDEPASSDDFEWVNAWANSGQPKKSAADAVEAPAHLSAPTQSAAADASLVSRSPGLRTEIPANGAAANSHANGAHAQPQPNGARANGSHANGITAAAPRDDRADRRNGSNGASPRQDNSVMPEPSTIAVPSRDADIAVFVGDNAVASPQAPRRSGRWTDLFRLVTRAGTPGSDAAPQLFVLDEPAAIQLDQPHARAPRGVAATNADQLARDIAEIQIVRDRLFASPARGTAPAPAAPARTSDYVPILVGVVIAFTSMVVFGAAASFVSLR